MSDEEIRINNNEGLQLKSSGKKEKNKDVEVMNGSSNRGYGNVRFRDEGMMRPR